MTERSEQAHAEHAAVDPVPAEQVTTDHCRTCNAAITRAVSSFPFCSERCRMADLGAWIDEKYTISRPIQESDLLDT